MAFSLLFSINLDPLKRTLDSHGQLVKLDLLGQR